MSSCSKPPATHVNIGSYDFKIPREHLLQGSIPWLPFEHSGAFRFIANPDDSIESQFIVTVEMSSSICNPASVPESNQLDVICLARNSNASRFHSRGSEYEKVYQQNDPTQWEYKLHDQDVTVAACYLMSNKQQSGLCTSLGRYNDLVYSVSLRDSNVSDLPSIHRNITNMLYLWEHGTQPSSVLR